MGCWIQPEPRDTGFEEGDVAHVLIGEFPGEDVEVFLQTLGGSGFGDGEEVLLDVPAEDDLGVGLAGFLGDVGDGGVGDEVGFVAEGCPGLGEDCFVEVVVDVLFLLVVGVEFDLVDGGGDAGFFDEAVDVGREEVGDADGFDEAFFLELDHGAPGLNVEVLGGVGPVDEVEVEVVEAHGVEGVFEGGDGGVVALVSAGYFGGDEDIFAVDGVAVDGFADAFFVVVVFGGVDEPVAAGEGFGDVGFCVGVVHGGGAEADGGDFVAVAEGVLLLHGVVLSCC